MIVRATITLLVLVLLAFPALAQEDITDDDVNSVAGQLYCPVCENIPLDVCGTQACADWRAEIRTQLESGRTSQQIIDDFVARYGERVIGTPQDPTLRALSLVTPWIVGALALLIAAITFARWQRLPGVPENTPKVTVTDDEYRARLERDLLERR
jgi:cytochrome c-type biogenesis protein CcmH